jgi:hypothetical protein
MPSLLYQATIPVFEQTLAALDACVDKAGAYATAHKIEPSVLLAARLRPDMLPFVRQTQIVCDGAKNMTARVAGVEPPRFEDNEASFDDIKARIKKTRDYLRGIDSHAIDAGPNKMRMKGADYVFHFALLNYYFHLTTAYDILRYCGVDLGKRDFLGAVPGISPA